MGRRWRRRCGTRAACATSHNPAVFMKVDATPTTVIEFGLYDREALPAGASLRVLHKADEARVKALEKAEADSKAAAAKLGADQEWDMMGPDLIIINEHDLRCLYFELKVVASAKKRTSVIRRMRWAGRALMAVFRHNVAPKVGHRLELPFFTIQSTRWALRPGARWRCWRRWVRRQRPACRLRGCPGQGGATTPPAQKIRARG